VNFTCRLATAITETTQTSVGNTRVIRTERKPNNGSKRASEMATQPSERTRSKYSV